MGGRAVFWRWRRNPLRRRCDVVEACTGVAAALLIAAGAPAAGAATAVAVEHSELRRSQGTHLATAFLTEDAAKAVENPYTGSIGKVLTPVRWTAPDGSTRTGLARVEPGSPAGSPATVWLDADGRLQQNRLTPAQAEAQGVVFGTVAAAGACALVLAGRWVVRLRIDRHRAAAWAREWEETGPSWGHRRA
ncbi:Rv1733c family protein [Actinacidiphila glaucinigra]|uniref:Rv1733c family protein n=1 Tax=Actinacidiphila glaucinigra TaxID=235986 RepID=UPI0035DFF583